MDPPPRRMTVDGHLANERGVGCESRHYIAFSPDAVYRLFASIKVTNFYRF